MVSVIIPTLNDEKTLARTLACLVPATVTGLVREVVIADGGSDDHTSVIADDSGASFVAVGADLGGRLKAGAERARGDWLLFINPDCLLEPGWALEVEAFIARAEQVPGGRMQSAAVFRYAVEDFGKAARRREQLVFLRNRLFALPYGDQGLLIHRQLYTHVGGYPVAPGLPDVDMVRRLGRRRLIFLRSAAIAQTPPADQGGPQSCAWRDLARFMLHALGVSTRVTARI